MTNSVTFSTTLGGDGSTVTDDANASTGLANGGHRARFVPALAQFVAVSSVVLAAAQNALNAPATGSTSTTSLAIGTGSKTLTIQTGKAYVVGQSVTVAATADPSNQLMHGFVTAYNSATGALTVDVKFVKGSGTYAVWSVSVVGPGGSASQIPYTPTGGVVSTDVQAAITELDADLTAGLATKQNAANNLTGVSAVAANGLYARTGASTAGARTLTGTAGRVAVTNGDGAAGNPTIDLATVSNAGGGAMNKVTVDSYGRVSGYSAAAASDITATLGFTPVQQGGGTGQGTNKLYVGWGASNLLLQVDATDFGSTWPINISGNAASASSVSWSGVSGKPTTMAGYGITDGIAAGDTRIAKAWANIDGVNGSARASYNVASITHPGAGIVQITFSSAMADANYAVAVSIVTQAYVYISSVTSSSFRVQTQNSAGTFADSSMIGVSVFR